MRSAAQLMAAARATMTKWPALWLPPILMNMAQSLAAVPLTTHAAQAVTAVAANVAALLVNAGWLAMIARAIRDERPTATSFFEGVNRRWGSILVGSLVFILILGAALAAIAVWGDHQYGSQPLRAWFDAFEKLPADKVADALRPEKLPLVVKQWMYLLMVWMTFAGGLTFVLLFWQPFTVIGDMPWYKAWLASVRLVFTRFGMAALFAVLHLIAFMAGLSIITGGNALLALFGLTMLLFVSIYFKTLYAQAVSDVVPGAQLDVKA
jgi:hypothetical protein